LLSSPIAGFGALSFWMMSKTALPPWLRRSRFSQLAAIAKMIDGLAEITADPCPKRQAGNMSDQCAARCPDLPKVM